MKWFKYLLSLMLGGFGVLFIKFPNHEYMALSILTGIIFVLLGIVCALPPIPHPGEIGRVK